MEIKVQCYGPTRRYTGAEFVTLTLHEPATVADALARLGERGDEFAQLLRQCAVAVGDELVRRTRPLQTGDELALLPPVAGG